MKRNEDDGKKERFDLNVLQIFLITCSKDLKSLIQEQNWGNRRPWESVEDFDLITPLQSTLSKNDKQAFKLIYKEVTNQANTISAYQQIMAILPEIIYLRPSFQPLISGFFKDDNETANTVTFCQKIDHPNLPKFGKGITIRSFEPLLGDLSKSEYQNTIDNGIR